MPLEEYHQALYSTKQKVHWVDPSGKTLCNNSGSFEIMYFFTVEVTCKTCLASYAKKRMNHDRSKNS
jgi:hypothetical protein